MVNDRIRFHSLVRGFSANRSVSSNPTLPQGLSMGPRFSATGASSPGLSARNPHSHFNGAVASHDRPPSFISSRSSFDGAVLSATETHHVRVRGTPHPLNRACPLTEQNAHAVDIGIRSLRWCPHEPRQWPSDSDRPRRFARWGSRSSAATTKSRRANPRLEASMGPSPTAQRRPACVKPAATPSPRSGVAGDGRAIVVGLESSVPAHRSGRGRADGSRSRGSKQALQSNRAFVR